jgi:succinate dehydrogenase/fumarate reductase flavoprotein subunit
MALAVAAAREQASRGGGCAAATGNMNPNDNWQVHHRHTMRGGKFLNNWRMAELHAKGGPDQVWNARGYLRGFINPEQPPQRRRRRRVTTPYRPSGVSI